MFKNIFKFRYKENNLQPLENELDKLQSDIYNKKISAQKIKSNFNFHIPDYIIDEIIENEKTKNFINLHYLINCAVVNERISQSNASLLKQVYKLNNKST